ncbi:hypothetical protein BLNAU_18760 [Blattamonas nauphoetae]|uniref:G-protein coupled receptors family 1 profile domain-containing protein n=1 Tax=Blattamonas nauphoetae TaxID=2049346 RepID=A0ABQ9X3G1_9EUKA|nr:hypothetical protein BLNAU_18760 [Blattamonas nauphoetae]
MMLMNDNTLDIDSTTYFCIAVNWIQFTLSIVTIVLASSEFLRRYLIPYCRKKDVSWDLNAWFHVFILAHPLMRAIASCFLPTACESIADEPAIARVFLVLANYFFNAACCLIVMQWSQLVHRQRQKRKRALAIIAVCDIIFCVVIPVILVIIVNSLDSRYASAHAVFVKIELTYCMVNNILIALLFLIYGSTAQIILKRLSQRKQNNPLLTLSKQDSPRWILAKHLLQVIFSVTIFTVRAALFMVFVFVPTTKFYVGFVNLLKDGIGDCILTVILLFLNVPVQRERKKKDNIDSSSLNQSLLDNSELSMGQMGTSSDVSRTDEMISWPPSAQPEQPSKQTVVTISQSSQV